MLPDILCLGTLKYSVLGNYLRLPQWYRTTITPNTFLNSHQLFQQKWQIVASRLLRVVDVTLYIHSKLLGEPLPLTFSCSPYKKSITPEWIKEQTPYIWQCYWLVTQLYNLYVGERYMLDVIKLFWRIKYFRNCPLFAIILNLYLLFVNLNPFSIIL